MRIVSVKRHDVGLEAGIDDLQPLDGGQHRHGGRNHRVAKEEGRANDAERQHESALLLQKRFNQHDQREDAAFAAVVCPHQEHDIFQRDDEDERPDQKGSHAQHGEAQIAPGGRHRVERFAHRVEWACSDVTEDDTDRGECKLYG